MSKPNWKTESDYEFTDGLTNAGWAWEFLRRTPQYREDWINANDQQKKFSAHQGDKWSNNHKNPFVIFDSPLPEGISPDDWALRENVEHYAPLRGYGSKWRLKGQIQDPALATPPQFELIASAKLLQWEETGHYFTSVAEDADVVVQNGKIAVVGIDLTRSQSAIDSDVRKLVKEEYNKRALDKLGPRDFKKRKTGGFF